MQNRFSSNSRYYLAYWLVWLLLAIIYATLLLFVGKLSFMAALVDAFVFGALFSVMGFFFPRLFPVLDLTFQLEMSRLKYRPPLRGFFSRKIFPNTILFFFWIYL